MNLIFRYFEFIATDHWSENFSLRRICPVAYKSIIQSDLKDSCTLIETIRVNGFVASNKQTERKEVP